MQNKLQKELTNIRVNPDGRKDITIQKADTKKNYEEQTVFNIKAEEDMKKIINFVFADMKYHKLKTRGVWKLEVPIWNLKRGKSWLLSQKRKRK